MKEWLRRHARLVAGSLGILIVAGLAYSALASGPARAQSRQPAGSPVAASAAAAVGHARASASSSRAARGLVSGRRQLVSVATGHIGRAGAPTPPPTSHALALALRQATGLDPSQVTARSVCGRPAAGHASCAAQTLVLRSTGAPVHPRVVRYRSLGRVGPAQARSAQSASPTPAPQPDTPAYLQQAYDLSYLSQTAGSTDTVAIVDAYASPTAEADLGTYRSTYGLPACTTANGCFKQVNEQGRASPLPGPGPGDSWPQEISLDLDAVSAICPNCHILLVDANSTNFSDLQSAVQTADSLGANQISASWSGPSSSPLSGTYTFPGVATVAATGDAGYAGAGQDNYPAAFPGVTAAGGTSLAPASSGPNARGFSEGAWSWNGASGGGSGCDLNFKRPSYQPAMGCTGRAYADLSADADPSTGLTVRYNGQWILVGGTSLSTPLVAAYYAVTGVGATTPQWAYADGGLLNDIVSGSSGTCAASISYICNAGPGYDGPTGMGSISGAVVTGAPGIGGPSIPGSAANTYTEATRSDGATITGGIYPNGLDTTWWIDYWPANGGSVQQTPATDIGSGAAPVGVVGYPTHLTANTTYDYELVAKNSDGTTDGYASSFTTAPASTTTPVATFTSSLALATPDSVGFNASGSTDSGATITDYSWDFGDGSPIDNAGAAPTATHQYANPGTYNVTLTVTNSNGQSETTTQTVIVFAVSPRQPSPQQPVSFTASNSTTSSNSYSWSFVGPAGPKSTGTTTTVANPTESLARGSYQVTLSATNVAGQTSSTTQTVIVDDPPTATISPSTTLTTPGSTVSFSSSATSPDTGGSIAGYSWNFGDGSTGTGQALVHSYANPGVYPVSLTVTDDLGESYTTPTQSITVDATPTAAFTSSPAQPSPGQQVSFDASGSTDSYGRITSYSWNFGDTGANGPGTSSLQGPTYTYANPGTYTVTLTVTNDAGQTNTVTRPVTIDDPPTATLAASPTLTTPGSSVTFTSTAASPATGGSITTYSWNFGDGSTLIGTNADPTHAYTSPGTYAVTLTVTDNLGVTATATTHVTVDAAPTAAFTASSNPVTAGSAIGFNAGGSSDSVGTITGYSWNFGDGATAKGQAPSHVYATPGTYTVSLTVTNDAGQTSTSTANVTVNSVPTVTQPSPPTPAPVPSPAPLPAPAPQPLTASLAGANKQKLAAALAHGVRVSLAVSQGTTASFQVTLPVLESRLAGSHRPKTSSIVLLRTGAEALGAGSHTITLKLSRAAAHELAGTGRLVLTVRVTLTEPNGAKLSRSVKIALTR